MTLNVSNIMQQVASSKNSHKKNNVALLNIMSRDADIALGGVFSALCRVLGTKKDDSQALLLLKFTASFLEFLKEKDSQFAIQLAEFLLENLIPGIESGQKMVRVRVLEILLNLINSLEEME